jgi:hypothetical protein
VGVSAVSGVARVRARGRGRAREGAEAAVGGEGRREVVDGAEPAVASARGPVLLHGKLRAFFSFWNERFVSFSARSVRSRSRASRL